jgi:hypothetical protein
LPGEQERRKGDTGNTGSQNPQRDVFQIEGMSYGVGQSPLGLWTGLATQGGISVVHQEQRLGSHEGESEK